MGLDIYLTKYDDFEDAKRREKEYEAFSEKSYDSVADDATEEEKDAARATRRAEAERLGLDEYGSASKDKEKIDSAKYPDHMFKIGYLRSSYNEAGINRILRDRVGRDLHDIFEPGERYEFRPDWTASHKRAVEMLAAFKDHLATHGTFGVTEMTPNELVSPIELVQDANAALKLFNDQRQRHHKGHGAYSCRDGHFWLDEPMKVCAIVQGAKPALFAQLRGEKNALVPCSYVIYERTDMDWYVQALEIVVEMCEWVIAQPDSQKMYLRWSG